MKSPSYNVRTSAVSEATCLALFDFYLNFCEKNQHRAMRQVLELLPVMLKIQPNDAIVVSIKTRIISELVAVLSHQGAQPLVKPAFKSLDLFLSKRMFSVESLLQTHAMSCHGNADPELQWDNFIDAVFEWLLVPDVAPAAGKLLVTLFLIRKDFSSTSEHTQIWQTWVRSGISRFPDILESVKNYVFVPLFKLDRRGSLTFLRFCGNQNDFVKLKSCEMTGSVLAYLAAIEVGKKAGLVVEPSKHYLHCMTEYLIVFVVTKNRIANKKEQDHIVLQGSNIASLLSFPSETVRCLAFSAITTSHLTATSFSACDLESLKAHMFALYTTTDAKARNEILSSTMHMIERLRVITSNLSKEIAGLLIASNQLTPDKPQMLSCALRDFDMHSDFLKWFCNFLLSEIAPTTSYQRQITALKSILMLLNSGLSGGGPINKSAHPAWPFHIMLSRNSKHTFLNLMVNPFEDIRVHAAQILDLIYATGPPGKPTSRSKARILMSTDIDLGKRDAMDDDQPQQDLRTYITYAEDFARRTGRPDFADGVARAYKLLFTVQKGSEKQIQLIDHLLSNLETNVRVLNENFIKAVQTSPVHGAFATLK